MDATISNVLHFKQAKKETEKRKKGRKERKKEDRRSILSSLSLLQGSGLSSPQQLEGSFENSGLGKPL